MFILRQINSIKANLSFFCFAVAFTSIATVSNSKMPQALNNIAVTYHQKSQEAK